MKDPRIIKAAKIIVDWSTRIKKDDYVQIHTDVLDKPLALEVYKLAIQRGAYPVLNVSLSLSWNIPVGPKKAIIKAMMPATRMIYSSVL